MGIRWATNELEISFRRHVSDKTPRTVRTKSNLSKTPDSISIRDHSNNYHTEAATHDSE